MKQMKEWIIITSCGLLLWLNGSSLAAQLVTVANQDMSCQNCHGLMPGTGQNGELFKPGAHASHKSIDCRKCHLKGADPSHIDGIVTLKPELAYQYGSNVSWPGLGGGSCGVVGQSFQPSGCHLSFPKAKCLWLPGKNCPEEEEKAPTH